MLNLLLFLLTFSSVYSQETAFEEFVIRYENGEIINTESVGYPFTKGDSMFVKVENEVNKTLGMLSTDKGVTWKDIYPRIYGEKYIEFLDAAEPHPISFEILKITQKEDEDSTIFEYFDFDGNLIRKNSIYRINSYNINYYKNPYNPKMLIEENRYSGGDREVKSANYSTDYGKSWRVFIPNPGGYVNSKIIIFLEV